MSFLFAECCLQVRWPPQLFRLACGLPVVVAAPESVRVASRSAEMMWHACFMHVHVSCSLFCAVFFFLH